MKLRRPRMTRQLVERLIGCVALAETEWENIFDPEADCDEARECRRNARAARQDLEWLFRMREWFDARAGKE